MRSIQRTLALALTLAVGPVFLPLGCAGARGPSMADPDMPEPVAQRLSACAQAHADHLHADQTLRFDVALANDGQVEEVSLRSATLDDEGLETCMVSALRLLSEDDLRLRRAEVGPRGRVGPEARALMGHPEALALCAASPPCVMVATIAVAATMTVAVWVYMQPPAHAGHITHAPPAVTTPTAASASPMPTTYVPTMPLSLSKEDQELWRKCWQQHDDYKQTQDDASDLANQMNPIANLLNNNKASAQQRADYCSLLDKRIMVKQREHKERSRYMELKCDKFDWFNAGLTEALRLARHKEALSNVNTELQNLYDMDKRFCK